MQSSQSRPLPQRYLRLANSALAGSSLALIGTFLVAYPYAQHFGLGTQIAAHLAIPVSAGVLKLGYVVRLASTEAIDKLAAKR